MSNTYRALRFVADETYGDLLYAEFTARGPLPFALCRQHTPLLAPPHNARAANTRTHARVRMRACARLRQPTSVWQPARVRY